MSNMVLREFTCYWPRYEHPFNGEPARENEMRIMAIDEQSAAEEFLKKAEPPTIKSGVTAKVFVLRVEWVSDSGFPMFHEYTTPPYSTKTA